MKVLSVTSEAVPLIKTGGLADVAGALPAALARYRVKMRVLLPGYPAVMAQMDGAEDVWSDPSLWGGPARILAKTHDEVDWLILDAPHLFDRPGGPYNGPEGDFWDNPERFAALSWVAAEIAKDGLRDGWRPDVVHAHDWQAGLTPAYLRYQDIATPSVLTIHNIAFQGWAGADRLASLRLPADAFHPGQLEYHGQISTLKAGMVTADAVTTVSPRYADELLRPEFGMGLEGVVAEAARQGRMQGILNGIDAAKWDPAKGEVGPAFNRNDLSGKAEAKAALLAEFGLNQTDGPLFVLVSRLSHQKGIDMVLEAIDTILDIGGNLALLGSGEPGLEHELRHAEDANPGRIGVRIGYDEALSTRMFLGGDAVLVPSRFEPCGLTQMYGLRFGTIPVVAATGGLADTVIHANPAALDAKAATGVVFHPVDGRGLRTALRHFGKLWQDETTITTMRRAGMAAKLDWQRSAGEYAALYKRLLA